jgi:hypothetical protein
MALDSGILRLQGERRVDSHLRRADWRAGSRTGSPGGASLFHSGG